MPPGVMKTKPKSREGRQSRSRNTTPSSSVSVPVSATPLQTAYLEIPISNLTLPTNIGYDDVLERHGGGVGIPDPKHLETISNDLKTLAALAVARADANDKGMRELAERRKQLLQEEQEIEREREANARNREDKGKDIIKKEAGEESEHRETTSRERSVGKPKKKKEPIVAREARPLNHGAHGLARQDGLDLPLEASPSKAANAPSPLQKNLEAGSGSSSSLSEGSPPPSPTLTARAPDLESAKPSPTESSSSSDEHQPPPAASVAQYQTFGPNPLIFDDPTVYEVLEVAEDMTEEEKKEIYCVASFPHDDLHDLIAGVPPNKDFSNAVKPNNQVQAHTFSGYLDGYLRPLKEEDIGFLNERGIRDKPFVMPTRGKRHYTEVWAEEDGSIAPDIPQQNRLPPNQPRGSLENMDDDMAETDLISNGPMLNRILSSMRFEHRTSPNEEKGQLNGLVNGAAESSLTNGDTLNGIPHEPNVFDEVINASQKPATLPPATALPESARQTSNIPNLSHAQIDDRLKAELRHIGFLAPDEEPDYDSHKDDEIAERLRYLQNRLREVMIMNGARKLRVLELAEEQMAYQEYSTILEDLDTQVQQAYLKRARTAGKNKKNAKRPGGGGQGTQAGVLPGGVGVGGISKPGIGDVARTLMTRRAKWEEKIGPVFRGDIRRVRGRGEGIFGDKEMNPLIRLETERLQEDMEEDDVRS